MRPSAALPSPQVIHTVLFRRLAAAGVALAMLGCSPDQSTQTYTFDGLTMGSTYTVKVVADPLPVSREVLQREIAGILGSVDAGMSTYLETSELSRLNRNPSTDWIPVSDALYSVLDVAMQVSRLSDGAFDISVGPLVNLWGFGPEGRRDAPPPKDAIAAARARTGWRNLELDPQRRAVRKRLPDLYIDLSAIAQGYGADEVGRYLESAGVRNYMAEVAGEIRAAGLNADGKAWRIGIERPGSGEPIVEQIIELRDAGLATSGDYRNYFEQDGVRYSHHIDPATGRPVTHNLASVTVVHPSATFADAMATALLVLGPERGLALAGREKLAVFLIIRAGSGFEEKDTEAFRRLLAE